MNYSCSSGAYNVWHSRTIDKIGPHRCCARMYSRYCFVRAAGGSDRRRDVCASVPCGGEEAAATAVAATFDRGATAADEWADERAGETRWDRPTNGWRRVDEPYGRAFTRTAHAPCHLSIGPWRPMRYRPGGGAPIKEHWLLYTLGILGSTIIIVITSSSWPVPGGSSVSGGAVWLC